MHKCQRLENMHKPNEPEHIKKILKKINTKSLLNLKKEMDKRTITSS
jgi:hypothetical protein